MSTARLAALWGMLLLCLVLGKVNTEDIGHCESEGLKKAVYSCYGYFGEMQSAILSGSQSICSFFQLYVKCVEPKVKRCNFDQFRVLRLYAEDKHRLSSSPFHCPIPKLEFNDTVQDYRITTGITGLADGLRHNDSALILAVISFMLWST